MLLHHLQSPLPHIPLHCLGHSPTLWGGHDDIRNHESSTCFQARQEILEDLYGGGVRPVLEDEA